MIQGWLRNVQLLSKIEANLLHRHLTSQLSLQNFRSSDAVRAQSHPPVTCFVGVFRAGRCNLE